MIGTRGSSNQAPLDGTSLSDSEIEQIWSDNYREAAIYLEEGHKNIQFDYHPKNKEELTAYLLTNNPVYQILDMIVALSLLSLGFFEKRQPELDLENDKAATHEHVVVLPIVELCLMGVSLIQTLMKLYWIGVTNLMRHKRTILKMLVLITLIIEVSVVLSTGKIHYRLTRIFRIVIVLDSYHMRLMLKNFCLTK